MKKYNGNFDEWRKWFNKSFSLQVNGKLKGLSTLLKMVGERYFVRFAIKLATMYARLVDGYLHRSERIDMKLHGLSIVVRFR